MKKESTFLVSFLLLGLMIKAQTLFTKINETESGVFFNNLIGETKETNVLSYAYLYNGGGTAIGDINNDGLPDIYFVGTMIPGKLYLNQGNFKFKDITESANVGGGDGFRTGVTFVDVNSDGLLDIYICKSGLADQKRRKNVLYVNNGNLTFTERAAEYGIDDESYSMQSYFYDMDLDGDLDLLILNHPYEMRYTNKVQLTYDKKGKLVAQQDTARLHVSYRYYQNEKGHFYDKTIAAGLGTHAYGLSAIIDDFNSDGYPDIYACNDFSNPDRLFINNKDGTFTDKLTEYFKHTCFSSMGSDCADINNDGYRDLMVVDMLPESFQRQKQLKGIGNYDNHNKRVEFGLGYQYEKNVLQLNNGNGSYSDISYLAGVAFTEWSWAPLLADFDNDGQKDIYVSNGYLRDVTDRDFMSYDGDSIQKELFKAKDPGEVMKILGQIPSTKTLNYFFKNNGNLTFKNLGKQSGVDFPSFSNGASYGDLDMDGDLDIIVNNMFDPAFIFKNNSSDSKNTNYIRFVLKGNSANTQGVGAVIDVETPDGKKQNQHFMPTKGFLSSHEFAVHFGLGASEKVNVKITWPTGKTQLLTNLTVNTVYTLSIDNASTPAKPEELAPLPFTDITNQTGINYTPNENTYIDFKLEPLLPHQFSQMGPCISVADINKDGLEDFFIGGCKDNEGIFYRQDLTGKFSVQKSAALTEDKKYEDTGAEFFDADNDGDQDLLVVSGGNEFPENETMYPVRLYMNDGKGNFKKSTTFPSIFTSSKAIAVEDFNKDGFKDIFIGGRVVPGHYGLIPKSYLLLNTKGVFTNITNRVPSLSEIGMVTDAVWCNLDSDTWPELVLVGEWMPLTIYKNKNGVLATTPSKVDNSNGWWNTIAKADIDGDGDLDLIGGNISVNTRYKGNEQYPITMTVSDFDNNGSTDCILSLYQDGVSYPIAVRDNLLDQMNFLKKKFLRYRDYSKATLSDIFMPEQLSKAKTYIANNIGNTVFINAGGGNFDIQLLPARAQVFPVNAVITEDFDKDGRLDILLAGNDYATEIESGRNDAGIGLVLKNQITNKFKPLPVTQSGFYLPGDVKCMKKIIIKNKPCILVGKNQSAIQVIGHTDNLK